MANIPTDIPMRRGMLFVLSSPSGAGKTTLARKLLEQEDNLFMSVSATTRTPRPSEEEGKDYIFVDQEAFQKMIKDGALLEHAEVFGNLYGTPLAPVEEHLQQGRDVLFDIDWQGAQQLHDRMRDDVVSVFILPPSIKDLEERLKKRAQDSADTITYRMSRAREEMSHWAEYEFVVVNEDFDRAFRDVQAILHAERSRRKRYMGLNDFVRRLSEDSA